MMLTGAGECVVSSFPAAKKSNDLATFVEARLGKPSHLLEGDKLKQFLAQVWSLRRPSLLMLASLKLL